LQTISQKSALQYLCVSSRELEFENFQVPLLPRILAHACEKREREGKRKTEQERVSERERETKRENEREREREREMSGRLLVRNLNQ